VAFVRSHAESGPAIDSLLPPGTHEPTTPSTADRTPPLPAAYGEPQLPSPLPQGDFTPVTDSPRVIRSGLGQFEVRRLTSAERANRRLVKNLVLGLFCIVVLLIVGYLLMR
jgi:hypothetical protein